MPPTSSKQIWKSPKHYVRLLLPNIIGHFRNSSSRLEDLYAPSLKSMSERMAFSTIYLTLEQWYLPLIPYCHVSRATKLLRDTTLYERLSSINNFMQSKFIQIDWVTLKIIDHLKQNDTQEAQIRQFKLPILFKLGSETLFLWAHSRLFFLANFLLITFYFRHQSLYSLAPNEISNNVCAFFNSWLIGGDRGMFFLQISASYNSSFSPLIALRFNLFLSENQIILLVYFIIRSISSP